MITDVKKNIVFIAYYNAVTIRTSTVILTNTEIRFTFLNNSIDSKSI